jgi:enamine deaminase RidA (YjgF/YER057c/UK114 family)
MPLEHIQPEGLFASEPLGFTQVVTSPPGKLVFVSGQVALDENAQVVGPGDLRAQAEQALANLGRALEAVGASPADVAFLRIYIANYDPSKLAVLGPLLPKFFGNKLPAQTLLGVQALATPDLLIELEALAVVGG